MVAKQKPKFQHGERVALFAVRRFDSQKALSLSVGIHPTQMSQYCSNAQSPGFVPIKQLFDAGLSIDWLLADESELYLYSMDRPRKGAKSDRRRVVEDMTTLELVQEVERRLREGE